MTEAQNSTGDSAQSKARRFKGWPFRWSMKDAPVATSTERLVLNAYAFHADADGTGAYPGPATLIEMTLMEESAIKRARRSLKARKLLVQGDQSRARRLPSGQRPVVYDVMVPFSWYRAQKAGGQALGAINVWRSEQDLDAIGPANRPDIAPAPAKAARKDKGTPRPRKQKTADADAEQQEPGDPEEGAASHPFEFGEEPPEDEGGLEDPPREGLKPGQEGATSTPTTPFNHAPNPANYVCGDGRSPSAVSKVPGESGCAASGNKNDPSPKARTADIAAVIRAIPGPLQKLLERDCPRGLPARITDTIGKALTGEQRTVDELVARMGRRWGVFGYEDAALSADGAGIRRSVGVLEELLSPSKCWGNDINCEDGFHRYTGEQCPRCIESVEDHRAQRAAEAPQVAVQQPARALGRETFTPGPYAPLPRPAGEPATFTEDAPERAVQAIRAGMRERVRVPR